MMRFDGAGVALVTPFDENLAIDEESLRALVEYVECGGVDFLVVLGTTAESATLTAEEKARVVRIVSEANRKHLPIMVGMGGNNTSEVIREIEHAEWLKDCQGILSITPFYNKPGQAGLYEHFKAISRATSLPICLYNVPSRTGVNMTAETMIRLAQECPNVLSLKEASGNLEQATALLKYKETRSDIKFFSGDDSILLPLMSMGFDGVISVASNVLPNEYTRLVQCVKAGELQEAQRLHLALSELCKLLFVEGNPTGIKAALHAKGIIRHNKLRLPLVSATHELYQKLFSFFNPNSLDGND